MNSAATCTTVVQIHSWCVTPHTAKKVPVQSCDSFSTKDLENHFCSVGEPLRNQSYTRVWSVRKDRDPTCGWKRRERNRAPDQDDTRPHRSNSTQPAPPVYNESSAQFRGTEAALPPAGNANTRCQNVLPTPQVPHHVIYLQHNK